MNEFLTILNEKILFYQNNNKPLNGIATMLRYDKNIDIINALIEYTSYLNINTTISERLYHFIYKLGNIQLCFCGKPLIYSGKLNKGYHATCGNKECKIKSKNENYKKTCIEKYGVTNTSKLESTKEKAKFTYFEKYGAYHNWAKNSTVIDKSHNTMYEKYGNKHALNIKEFKEKRINSCLSKHNTLDFLNCDKSNKTKIIKYGTTNIMDVSYIKEKVSVNNIKTKQYKFINKSKDYVKYIKLDKNFFEFECNVCNNISKELRTFCNIRIRNNRTCCVHCDPIPTPSWVSNMEIEIHNFIKTIYNGNIIFNTKNIIKPYELDIYLPELKIAIEFNGLYWHSELYKKTNYHLEKLNECEKSDIRLINIWEDDWIYKQDLIKSKLMNILNINQTIIYARNTIIKEVSNNEVKDFLNYNHIQGYTNSKYNIGLYFNDNLVSIMTFGKSRKLISGNTENIELHRFCSLQNHIIVGGASKLFNYFKNTYNIQKIISYCDRSYSFKNNFYEKIGFKFIKETAPNYFYIVNGIKSNRLNWTKDKLVKLGYDKNKTEREIMNELKYYRIYDCGSFVYEFNL